MVTENKKLNIVDLVNNYGCFDLQFRKDTRHKRTGSPTYYRWNTQFIITSSKDKIELLNKIGAELKCGKTNVSKDQARFSVQKIEDINTKIIPYFKKNQLSGKKKSDFNLWQKAVEIIYKNKGKSFLTWKRNEFLQLLEIHKSAVKYKEKPRQSKWTKTAEELAKNLKP
jgi:hypothetical protein